MLFLARPRFILCVDRAGGAVAAQLDKLSLFRWEPGEDIAFLPADHDRSAQFGLQLVEIRGAGKIPAVAVVVCVAEILRVIPELREHVRSQVVKDAPAFDRAVRDWRTGERNAEPRFEPR